MFQFQDEIHHVFAHLRSVNAVHETVVLESSVLRLNKRKRGEHGYFDENSRNTSLKYGKSDVCELYQGTVVKHKLQLSDRYH